MYRSGRPSPLRSPTTDSVSRWSGAPGSGSAGAVRKNVAWAGGDRRKIAPAATAKARITRMGTSKQSTIAQPRASSPGRQLPERARRAARVGMEAQERGGVLRLGRVEAHPAVAALVLGGVQGEVGGLHDPLPAEGAGLSPREREGREADGAGDAQGDTALEVEGQGRHARADLLGDLGRLLAVHEAHDGQELLAAPA